MRSTSKEARAAFRAYIMEHFDPSGYTDEIQQDWPSVARFILETFRSEKYHLPQDLSYYHRNEAAAFEDWASGLPSVLDCCFWYNRSAVDDLGAILRQTEEEKAKYTEAEAEKRLTWFIYRTLKEVER